jgi:hypothetical protein
MQDYEKLGVFYLGRLFDQVKGSVSEDLLLYDSRDLTTHAVCVGMTGSGKTGLCVGLLEEAAIDGIPALIIDPKGDLGNLLLNFPDLQSADFRPWIEEAEAARQGQAPDAFASRTAQAWREGLAAWGQDASRVARLRSAVDMAIYTPGSNAGRPLSVLRSFSAPGPDVVADGTALRDRIVATASGLLGLVGIAGDPLRSREHILMATILDQAWRQGRSLDIPALISAIQKPPFDKVGVFDVETFYPATERLDLAMALNNLLASPGYSAWMDGEPLDIQSLLYTPEGKPRLSIISIAHLSDSERMFVVTLVLNEMVAWMRTQSGTTSLRALLYMDEIFGYFPPSAMPPSKMPMLTLLKQARAFGVGVVLSTQNPVDLDYKGLANAGTWLIGRLQTDRDKARVIEGLEGALGGVAGFDRARIETLLAGLGKRVFLMHNVHEDQPVLFQSRWTLSYLRGPMTLRQIQTVMAGRNESQQNRPRTVSERGPLPEPRSVGPMRGEGMEKPAGPAMVAEYFVKNGRSAQHGQPESYRPAVLGLSKLHFVDAKAGVDVWVPFAHLAPFSPGGADALWPESRALAEGEAALDSRPVTGACFAELPAGALRQANYTDWGKSLKAFLYQSVTLDVLACPVLKAASRPGETEGDFRVRLGQQLREKRDQEAERLRRQYGPKLAAIQEQLRRAEARVETEKSQARQQTAQTVISVVATVLGAFCGRKTMSVGNVGRATTAVRGAGRAMREREDIQRASESVAAVQERLKALQQEFDQEAERVQDGCDPALLEFNRVQLRPRKTDVSVSEVALAWEPSGA